MFKGCENLNAKSKISLTLCINYILATLLYTFCGAYITKMVVMTFSLQHFLILGTLNKIFHLVKVIMNIRMLRTCQVVAYTSKIGSYKIKRVTLTVK